MNQKNHLFSKKWTAAKKAEALIFWVFRIATYFVILCAGYLFGDIIAKGAGSVFTSKAPFINFEFLTEAPQTLHVFELKKVVDERSRLEREAVALRNKRLMLSKHNEAQSTEIGNELEALQKKIDALSAQNEVSRLLYSNSEYVKLDTQPDLSKYKYSTYAYSGGGIFPAIVGTVLLVTGSVLIALVLGVLCAIYLSEYSRRGRFLDLVRLSIINLAGVPSIVFGLFGYGLFVYAAPIITAAPLPTSALVLPFLGDYSISFEGWGVSVLAGWFTLAFMALPLIITASEESMRSIPKGFREGSLALGATQWKTIRTNVLPYALPGILTSSVMSITRVAGETAPIMFTAAFAIRDELPWEGNENWWDMFFNGVMALPYHIYVVSAKIPNSEYTRGMQYGTAFVFLVIVGSLALTSILLRVRARNKYRW